MTFLIRLKNFVFNIASLLIIFPVFVILSLVTSKKNRKKGKKIVWFGAYGNGNLGDDLIFYSLKRVLKLKDFDINLSIRRDKFLKNYGVKYFLKGEQFYDYWRYIKVIRSSDILILGGGGLFEYYYPSKPAYRMMLIYLCPIMIASIFNKHIYVLGVGVNERKIPNGIVRLIFKLVLSEADIIVTRDLKSKEGLLVNGVNTKIINSFDPVLSLNLKQKEVRNNTKIIGVLLWPYFLWPHFYENSKDIDQEKTLKHQQFIAKIQLIIEGLKDKCEIRFLTFHFSDTLLYKELNVHYYPKADLNRFLKSMQSLDVLLSMRYHGQITAFLNNTPVISLSVQEKMDAIMKNFHFENFNHNIENFDPNIIIDQIQQVLDDETLKTKIDKNRNEFQEDIVKNYSRILS